MTPGSAGLGMTSPDALDQWFENLGSYEETLEEMAAASLDQNFKEELVAIEQWFRVLSEAERTAALYSLLQHSSQVCGVLHMKNTLLTHSTRCRSDSSLQSSSK